MEKTRLVQHEFDEIQQISYTVKPVIHDCTVHFHNFYELELILKGSGTTTLNGMEYKVKPNMAVLLSPNDFHDYISDGSILMINLQFGTEMIPNIKMPFFDSPVCFLDDSDADILRTTLELIGYAYTLDNHNYTKKLLEAALVFLIPHLKKSEGYSHLPSSIGMAVSYIHSHFKENPSLESAAQSVFLDKNYFCTLFRKQTGKTYKLYLRELKLSYALRLLRYTDLSVTEISLESGYTSMPHFYREFHSMYGFSPSEIRKNNGQ